MNMLPADADTRHWIGSFWMLKVNKLMGRPMVVKKAAHVKASLRAKSVPGMVAQSNRNMSCTNAVECSRTGRQRETGASVGCMWSAKSKLRQVGEVAAQTGWYNTQ
jgi:hypothetical protein